MAHFPKPAEGSWTEHYPELGTGPVSYEDSISPDHYELERKAIFARTWLNVGRVEQLPRNGSYFTKELDAAGTSLVVVRGTDGEIHVFHNICRHRGNKLVWTDYPGEETSGTCRQFTCKYHGWRYATEGQLTFVQQESEFFDLDRDDYGLAGVQVETWEGFIFVNLDPDNTTSLREYLGEFGDGLAGYPFDEMTQVYKYRADVGSQLEAVHRRLRRVLPRTHPPRQAGHRRGVAQALRLSASRRWPTSSTGPTAWCRRGAACRRPRTSTWSSRWSGCCSSGLFGPWAKPDIEGLDRAASGAQPGPPPGLGCRLVRVLPQLHAAHLGAGLVPHLPLLADLLQHAHLRGDAVLRPAEDRPSSASSRSWPPSPSRSTRSRTATRWKPPRPCSSPGR